MHSSPSKYWLLSLLLALFFVGNLDVQIISPILPLLQKDFRISVFLAGFTVTAYSLSGAIWALVVGPLSDRFGRLIFLRLAAVVFAAGSGLAFISRHFELYLAARLLAGIAGGTFSACIIAQIADLFPYEQRGRAMGLVGAVYSLSAVLGVPLGAIFAEARGWQPLYIFFALATLIIALLLRTALLPDATSARFRGYALKSLPGLFTGAIKRQAREYAGFWVNRKTRQGLLLAFAVTATSTSLMTYLGAWLMQEFGLHGETVGLVFFAAGGSTVLGSVAGGYLADKLGRINLVGAGSLIIAGIMLTTALVNSQPAIFTFCIAGGLSLAVREGPYQALITELVASGERGAYIAMRSTIAKVSMGISAAVAGLLFEMSGYVAVTAFSAACSLAAALLVLLSIRKLHDEQAAVAPTAQKEMLSA